LKSRIFENVPALALPSGLDHPARWGRGFSHRGRGGVMLLTAKKIKKTQKEIYLLTIEQNLDILFPEVIKHESN
jgi:hypothetical protein